MGVVIHYFVLATRTPMLLTSCLSRDEPVQKHPRVSFCAWKTNQPDAKCCPPPSALTCTAAFVPLCGLKCDHCSGVTQLKRQQQNGYCEARQHNTTHLWRIRGLSEMDTFDPNTRSLNVRLQHTVRYSLNELNTHNKNLMKTTKPAWGCCFMWLVQICDRWIENSLHQHVNNFALFLFRAFGAPPVSPSTSRH